MTTRVSGIDLRSRYGRQSLGTVWETCVGSELPNWGERRDSFRSDKIGLSAIIIEDNIISRGRQDIELMSPRRLRKRCNIICGGERTMMRNAESIHAHRYCPFW